MSYARRLAVLEAELSPEREPRACILFNEPDTEAAIARWREAHCWPDDGRHPIAALLVSWSTDGDAPAR